MLKLSFSPIRLNCKILGDAFTWTPSGGLALKKYVLLVLPIFVTVLVIVTVVLRLGIAKDGQLRLSVEGGLGGQLNGELSSIRDLGPAVQKQRRQSSQEASQIRPGSVALVGRKWPAPNWKGVALLPPASVIALPKLFVMAAVTQKWDGQV